MGNPFWEANLDHTDNKCVPMQRETRFSCLRSVPMQRGAHFLTKLHSHAGGARFSSDRPHLAGLDWSVWTDLSGPVSGPVRLDPVRLDPVCLDPVCLGPVCLDSVCLDPVRISPISFAASSFPPPASKPLPLTPIRICGVLCICMAVAPMCIHVCTDSNSEDYRSASRSVYLNQLYLITFVLNTLCRPSCFV